MNYVSMATVIEIFEPCQDIREYTLQLVQERKYQPGSFVQLTLDVVNASQVWPESRTFSIASYRKGAMRLIIKNVGLYTGRIFSEMHIGSQCTIKYPFGNLFDKNTVNDRHILIAGGVGITPFLSLIDYFEQERKLQHIYLFYSVKTSRDLLHWTEIKEKLGDRVQVHITRESVEGFLNRRILLNDIQVLATLQDQIYICGSGEFNNSFKQELIQQGYLNIHMDEWE